MDTAFLKSLIQHDFESTNDKMSNLDVDKYRTILSCSVIFDDLELFIHLLYFKENSNKINSYKFLICKLFDDRFYINSLLIDCRNKEKYFNILKDFLPEDFDYSFLAAVCSFGMKRKEEKINGTDSKINYILDYYKDITKKF